MRSVVRVSEGRGVRVSRLRSFLEMVRAVQEAAFAGGLLEEKEENVTRRLFCIFSVAFQGHFSWPTCPQSCSHPRSLLRSRRTYDASLPPTERPIIPACVGASGVCACCWMRNCSSGTLESCRSCCGLMSLEVVGEIFWSKLPLEWCRRVLLELPP